VSLIRAKRIYAKIQENIASTKMIVLKPAGAEAVLTTPLAHRPLLAASVHLPLSA